MHVWSCSVTVHMRCDLSSLLAPSQRSKGLAEEKLQWIYNPNVLAMVTCCLLMKPSLVPLSISTQIARVLSNRAVYRGILERIAGDANGVTDLNNTYIQCKSRAQVPLCSLPPSLCLFSSISFPLDTLHNPEVYANIIQPGNLEG